MIDTLIFKLDDVEHEIGLDRTRSPRALEKLLATLPATIDIHCAKIAGSHIMWPVPFVEGLEDSSDVLTMPAGAFFFWPERQYLEITYDALQAETAAVSYLGRLRGDIGWLREFADRQRRLQGQRIFTAEIFVPGTTLRTADRPVHGESPLDGLRAARQRVWQEEPAEVCSLLDRRGLNIPFGPLVLAEGEFRKLHELLWRLWQAGEGRDDTSTADIACFLCEAAITRVAGFCHLLEAGDVLEQGIACLRSGDAPVKDVLVELLLYAGRMAAWLDLHICWEPMNDLTLKALNRDPGQEPH